jgi:hypothetical protein
MKSLKVAAIAGASGAALAVATIALAGTGVGGVFNLGADNTVNKTTTLRSTSSFSGPQLQVKNAGGGPALDLQVNSGKAPLTVNSSSKVANLNADKLDGVDASGFVQGKGLVVKGSGDPNAGITQGIMSTDHFLIQYACPSDTANDGTAIFFNEANATVDLFVDNGGGNPIYSSLAGYPNGSYYAGASATGELNQFQAHWSDGTVATVFVSSVHKSNPRFGAYWCHADAQAVQSG